MDPGNDKPGNSFLVREIILLYLLYGGCSVLLLRQSPFGADERKDTKVYVVSVVGTLS